MTAKPIAGVALVLIAVASNWSGSRSPILQAEGQAVTSLGTVTPIDVPGHEHTRGRHQRLGCGCRTVPQCGSDARLPA